MLRAVNTQQIMQLCFPNPATDWNLKALFRRVWTDSLFVPLDVYFEFVQFEWSFFSIILYSSVFT